MARYPGATWKPIARYEPGGSSGGAMPVPRRLIYHTAVSGSSSLFPLFNTPGRAVAHFYVAANGDCEQYVDTARMSSAVLEGNHDCITVETQDIGGPFPSWSGSNVPEWTPAQVERLADIAKFCQAKHGIPLTRLTSSRTGLSGVGWHRLGIDGNFPDGLLDGRDGTGELWSFSGGKACPGDRRIQQVVNEVLPMAREGGTSGDDMDLNDKLGSGDNAPTVREALRAAVHANKAIGVMRHMLKDRLNSLADDLDQASTTEELNAVKKRIRADIAALDDETDA